MARERFEFASEGERLIGALELPDGTARGVVVLTGPLTSVKEQATGSYARALAERGFAALAFDHRGFGESGGVPRQLESPPAKVEDIRNAVSALAEHAPTANLAVFGVGVCAGGGYMAEAVASDPRLRAFAGVAGVYPDAARVRASMGEKYDAALARAEKAGQRFRETGEAETIPAVGPNHGDVAMPLDEAYAYYGTPRGAVANYVNGFAVQSRAYTLTFDAQGTAARIRVPTLIVHSEKALAPSWARSFFAGLVVAKRELWVPSQGQIDFYDDPALIGPVSDAIVEWFSENT